MTRHIVTTIVLLVCLYLMPKSVALVYRGICVPRILRHVQASCQVGYPGAYSAASTNHEPDEYLFVVRDEKEGAIIETYYGVDCTYRVVRSEGGRFRSLTSGYVIYWFPLLPAWVAAVMMFIVAVRITGRLLLTRSAAVAADPRHWTTGEKSAMAYSMLVLLTTVALYLAGLWGYGVR